MTMKSPSYKQIIIPMNNENKNEFMKNSSDYIINITGYSKTSSLSVKQIILD